MGVAADLAMALDRVTFAREALAFEPDPWQAEVLRSSAKRLLMNCCRQSGKSTTAAVLALHEALYRPPALVLVLSPSLRQSSELFRKIVAFNDRLGRPVPSVQATATTLAMEHGSRIVSLPGKHETIRGFSGVRLVVIDEAAQVPDDLYVAVNPMLATSRGRLVALSTPYGRRGWFAEAWNDPHAAWERVRVTAEQCPRIPPAFLAEQRQLLGERWYRQEYLCSFEETVGQVFGTDAVLAAFDSPERPLFGGS